MRFKTWAWGLSLATVALLSACGGGGSSKASMRLLNASIGYSALDMVVGDDEKTVNSSIAYAAVGDYASIATDDSGTQVQSSTNGSTLVSTTPSLTSGYKYTMIAYGVSGSVKTTLLQENQDNPDSGKSKLLILNLAPDAGAVDIYETGTSETTLDDAATVASSISSGSGSGYTSLKSGTYRLVVTAAGDKTDIRLDIPSITLPDAGVSSLILTGSNGGLLVNGMQLIQKGAVTNYANTAARVRVVSGLTGAATVTATVDSTTLASAATSPTIGSYSKITAGSQTLTYAINGTSSTAALSLTAGNDYTVLLYGNPSSPTLTILSDDNKLPTTSTYAKIRVLNGVTNNTGTLTLYVDYAAKGAATPGNASTPQTIPASTSSYLTVSSASTNSTLWATSSTSGTTITAQGVYTVFMLGDGTSSSTVSGSLVRER